MRFTAITATLLLAVGAIASPNPMGDLTDLSVSSEDVILARAALADATPLEARSLSKRDWKCGNRKYSMGAIMAAIAKALACIAEGSVHGNGCYPHEFKDHDGVFGGSYWEFPIKDGGSIFGSSKNQKPGLDRVLFTKGGSFFKLITHDGAAKGQFHECIDLD
ncbi:hypothetical protein CKM354_000890400 [Cercospora kikuchii]|uniref:ribonuclease T1 n=1 Tax=Cercospora kikuchii TaxID=84275 RepID=A0A9P3FFS7_9PEZI|nr:uncharacterized protein CKM354_000890400 [Cercospora kikuchii]GIZ45751.1 hypothetical protein CKM354_000890400 [Cercospora kikuchii]